MPNWCSNQLTITGPIEELRRFDQNCKGFDRFDQDKNKKLKFSFHALLPTPQDIIQAHLDDSSNQKWYNWSLQHWGTKWDVSDIDYDFDQEIPKITVLFATAWGPPTNLFSNIKTQYPNLYFELKYEEGGMGFAGIFTAHGDDETDDCYDSSDCEKYDQLLIEYFNYNPEWLVWSRSEDPDFENEPNMHI